MNKNTTFNFPHSVLLSYFLLVFCSANLFSQNPVNPICEEGDCPQEIFDIKINEPLVPTSGYDNSRTEEFKKAYDSFTQIKSKYENNPGWKQNYYTSQIGGKSCLRHYQLESMFSYEYFRNPQFKTYLDGLGKNKDEYIKSGFNNARKGQNLKARMNNYCKSELNNLEEKPGPKLDDMLMVYQQLGEELGYFDKQGNLIKPIEIPEEEKKAIQAIQNQPILSKKQQIEQLKERVAQLPLGQETQNTINKLGNDLAAAKSRSGKFGNFIKALLPVATALLAPQLPLIANIGKVTDFLGDLLNWKPRFPRIALLDKVKGLFNRGKGLKEKAEGLFGKSEKFQNKIKGLGQQAQKLQDNIDDKLKTLDDLKKELAELQNKKEDLTAKLEDRPRRILDELTTAVEDTEKRAMDLVNQTDKESKDKDKLIKELEELESKKDELQDEQDQLENDLQNLTDQGEELKKAADAIGQEVEEAKKEDEKLDGMNQSLTQLTSDEKLKENLKICEDDLKGLLTQIQPVAEAQNKLKGKFDKVKDKPGNLLQKVKTLIGKQGKLKIPKLDIPFADKTVQKVDGLLEKANLLGAAVELLTGKKSKIQDKIEQIDLKFTNVQNAYNNREQELEKLKGDLLGIIDEKTGLKEKFEQATGNIGDLEKSYQDFIRRYNIFDEESKCVDLNILEEKIEEVKKDQAEIEPEIDELEKEVEEAEREEEELEAETNELERELEEESTKALELKEEEERLKTQLGEDVKLEAVTPEEWSDEFEVKRDYWEAVFHPDDEVVEGFKGRYFQVRLKDAEKNVKLLFGPGEYFMDRGDFRDNYGSVIGAFVTESLNALHQSERDGIKLFVQGSADITGQNTFKGKLDDSFKYDQVSVLPQKGDSDRFESSPRALDIPEQGFTNEDLPNLRGNFLREMISIYSRKLEPTLLEGSVTKVVDKEDRNAVIYLFIPEYLVEKYSKY